MKQEFTLDKLKELTDNAIEPYLVSIEQALQVPSNQHFTREQQAQLVKQMFHRSLRLISFNFLQEVDTYINQLIQADIEKEKKAQAKAERQAVLKKAAKKEVIGKKMTLKELREKRAKITNPNQES